MDVCQMETIGVERRVANRRSLLIRVKGAFISRPRALHCNEMQFHVSLYPSHLYSATNCSFWIYLNSICPLQILSAIDSIRVLPFTLPLSVASWWTVKSIKCGNLLMNCAIATTPSTPRTVRELNATSAAPERTTEYEFIKRRCRDCNNGENLWEHLAG